MSKDYSCDELIIGVCSGIGADKKTVIDSLKYEFKRFDFESIDIKITKIYKKLNIGRINGKNRLKKIENKISVGDKLCEKYGLNSIHAQLAVFLISHERQKNDRSKKVFIIDQLKRPEEYHYLKKIYRRSFFLIGVFEDEKKRLNSLIDGDEDNYPTAKMLIQKDGEDSQNIYGQHLKNLFPESHFIVDAGLRSSCKKQIKRFVELLFSYNFHTPTIAESCMYLAKGVSLRSADLSRQVGVVIADDNGNIITVGCNDVPKPGGGLYSSEDNVDMRDYAYGYDPNKKTIQKNLDDLVKNLIGMIPNKNKKKLEDALKIYSKDQLEYSRCVHAEEAAICDAAWRGVSLKATTLYSTTFPCHLCAKLIMASGIKEVIYVEPYQKSIVHKLFEETVALFQNEHHPAKLNFTHFTGVKPRTFRHVFNVSDPEGDRRKNKSGKVIDIGREDKHELIYSLRVLHSCFYLMNEHSSVQCLHEIIPDLLGKYENYKKLTFEDLERGVYYNIKSFREIEKRRLER